MAVARNNSLMSLICSCAFIAKSALLREVPVGRCGLGHAHGGRAHAIARHLEQISGVLDPIGRELVLWHGAPRGWRSASTASVGSQGRR